MQDHSDLSIRRRPMENHRLPTSIRGRIYRDLMRTVMAAEGLEAGATTAITTMDSLRSRRFDIITMGGPHHRHRRPGVLERIVTMAMTDTIEARAATDLRPSCLQV